jgi:hypothetical protein
MIVTKKCIEVIQVTMIMSRDKRMKTTVIGRISSVVERRYRDKKGLFTALSNSCSWNTEHRNKFSAVDVTEKRVDENHARMIMNGEDR